MPAIKQYAYKGQGETNQKRYWYSSAVRVGPWINCAGQGGWPTDRMEFPDDIEEEIDQAFRNVDTALKDAGSKGWNQVTKITSYHVPLNEVHLNRMAKNFKEWMPEHHPTWTCIETPMLGAGPRMRVEIQVEAYDEEGADK